MGNALYGKVNDMVSKILMKAKSSDPLFSSWYVFATELYFSSSTNIHKGFPLIKPRQNLGLVHKENTMIDSFLDNVLICIQGFDMHFPSCLS